MAKFNQENSNISSDLEYCNDQRREDSNFTKPVAYSL